MSLAQNHKDKLTANNDRTGGGNVSLYFCRSFSIGTTQAKQSRNLTRNYSLLFVEFQITVRKDFEDAASVVALKGY